jgi:hypothetical protein
MISSVQITNKWGAGVLLLRELAAGSPWILETYLEAGEASILAAFSVNSAVADDLAAQREGPMLQLKFLFRSEH